MKGEKKRERGWGMVFPPPSGENILEPWVARGVITKGRHESLSKSKIASHLRHAQTTPNNYIEKIYIQLKCSKYELLGHIEQ